MSKDNKSTDEEAKRLMMEFSKGKNIHNKNSIPTEDDKNKDIHNGGDQDN